MRGRVLSAAKPQPKAEAQGRSGVRGQGSVVPGRILGRSLSVGMRHRGQKLSLEMTGRGPWSRTISCKRKNPFLQKHQADVMGILHCFDRLRFQGSLRYLYCTEVFEEYLNKAKVLCKDFKRFATGLTEKICQQAEQLAKSLGRPFTYLGSSAIS
jgi:hypothetical protein